MSSEMTGMGPTGSCMVTTGVRLAYRDVGNGEPVLLIIGTAGSLGLWAPLEPALIASRRVVALDNRGLGASERGEGRITTASMADDAAALLDALGIDRVHVLGWSLGSAIGQELALRHPDRVGCLVLDGTWGRVDGFQRAGLGALRYPWDHGDLTAGLDAFGLVFSPQLLDSPEFPQLLEQYLPLFPQTPEQIRVVSEQWDAVLAHDTIERLPEITAPTLVFSAEHDVITPRWQCQAVANAIPRAELACIDGPGSSHALHLERTDEFARVLTGFLDRHPLD